MLGLARVALDEGDIASTKAHIGDALRVAQETDIDFLYLACLGGGAELALHEGKAVWAAECLGVLGAHPSLDFTERYFIDRRLFPKLKTALGTFEETKNRGTKRGLSVMISELLSMLT